MVNSFSSEGPVKPPQGPPGSNGHGEPDPNVHRLPPAPAGPPPNPGKEGTPFPLGPQTPQPPKEPEK